MLTNYVILWVVSYARTMTVFRGSTANYQDCKPPGFYKRRKARPPFWWIYNTNNGLAMMPFYWLTPSLVVANAPSIWYHPILWEWLAINPTASGHGEISGECPLGSWNFYSVHFLHGSTSQSQTVHEQLTPANDIPKYPFTLKDKESEGDDSDYGIFQWA